MDPISSANSTGLTSPGKAAMMAAQGAAAGKRLNDTAAMLNGMDVGAESKLSPAELQKIDAAAKDFEAVFLSEMFKPMFESVEVDSEFGGGRGEEVFRGMMTQEYGKAFAERGGIGLAAKVKEHMIRLQAGMSELASQTASGVARAATDIKATITDPSLTTTEPVNDLY